MVDVADIMDYEQGMMSDEDMLRMFGELVKDGTAWRLQGSYGRTAKQLIDSGLIMQDGTVDWDYYNSLERGY